MITEGKMQYLYDDKGRRYLDVSPVHPACLALYPTLLSEYQCPCLHMTWLPSLSIDSAVLARLGLSCPTVLE